MKRLSEKTGWEKIELMLIWPLGYHPAAEIWQTSAIHAAPLLITLLHSKLSSAYFWQREGEQGKPRAKPEICLQRSRSSNHALKAPGEHTNSAVRYPWGKYPFTSRQHTKVCLKAGLNRKADTHQHTGCVEYPSCFYSSQGWADLPVLAGLWGDRWMKRSSDLDQSCQNFKVNLAGKLQLTQKISNIEFYVCRGFICWRIYGLNIDLKLVL